MYLYQKKHQALTVNVNKCNVTTAILKHVIFYLMFRWQAEEFTS